MFTLTFQGIEFQLQPGQNLGSKFSLHHVQLDQVVLELSNFTGQLLVTPSTVADGLQDLQSTMTSDCENVLESSHSLNTILPPLSQTQTEDRITTTNIPPSPEPKETEESVTTTQSKVCTCINMNSYRQIHRCCLFS
jgi:hypothetical protein